MANSPKRNKKDSDYEFRKKKVDDKRKALNLRRKRREKDALRKPVVRV